MSDTPAEKSRGLSQRNYILLLLALVFVIDALAMMFAPPYDPKGEPGGRVRLPRLLHQRQPGAAGAARRVARRTTATTA